MITPSLAIVLSGIVKDYRGLRPLRVASLAVEHGERVALGGVDAVAAEALVNLITGAVLPDEGTVTVEGMGTAAISDGDAWLASLDRFGMVSPRAVLLEGSTLLQNLTLPLSLKIDAIAPEVKRRAEALAIETGLSLERLGIRAGECTFEERVRTQVARALALDPRILLLEHPSATLPREIVDRFARELAAVVERRGITALAMTEDPTFAKPFATRWLAVKPANGEVVPVRSRWKLFG